MQENQNKFEYTYSAPSEAERREIESIRRQYEEHPRSAESKLERLRKLDAYVKNSATCVALILGVVGLLIFGLGMAMVLEWALPVWGFWWASSEFRRLRLLIPCIVPYPNATRKNTARKFCGFPKNYYKNN